MPLPDFEHHAKGIGRGEDRRWKTRIMRLRPDGESEVRIVDEDSGIVARVKLRQTKGRWKMDGGRLVDGLSAVAIELRRIDGERLRVQDIHSAPIGRFFRAAEAKIHIRTGKYL